VYENLDCFSLASFLISKNPVRNMVCVRHARAAETRAKIVHGPPFSRYFSRSAGFGAKSAFLSGFDVVFVFCGGFERAAVKLLIWVGCRWAVVGARFCGPVWVRG